MQEECDPCGHAECQVQPGSDTLGPSVTDEDSDVSGGGRIGTLRVEEVGRVMRADGAELGVGVCDLGAGHVFVVIAHTCDDVSAQDHDGPDGDDGAHDDECTEHPGTMLVDLQAFDVVIRHGYAKGCNDHQEGDPCLNGRRSTLDVTGYH